MSRLHRSHRTAGFSLAELLVVLVVLVLVATFTVPPLLGYIHRGKMEGIARQTALQMQAARMEAIRANVPTRVVADFAADEIYAFTDLDRDGAFDPARDRFLGRQPLPSHVFFRAAEDTAAEDVNALINFDDGRSCPGTCPPGGWADFRPDGSALKPGAFRFGDERGNCLEVRITTAATGRVEVRKYDPVSGEYWPQGEVGGQGKSWEWF
jgi:prepilin-type N-terminal cleavage/methylation domain-containing protein